MATSIIKADEIRKVNDTVLMSDGALSSNVQFPAGHIIQQAFNAYTYTADFGAAAGTPEVFHPVVSMTMKNANARVFAILVLGDLYKAGNNLATFKLAYKNSDFSTQMTGQALSSATCGVSTSSTQVFNFIRNDKTPFTLPLLADITNSANETIYFAMEGSTTSQTLWINYAGNNGANGNLTIMEIQK